MNEKVLCATLWPLDSLFALNRMSFLATLRRALLILGAWAPIFLAICWYEGTLNISGEGIGLIEHVGFHVFYAVHILVVILVPKTLRRCTEALGRVSETIDQSEVRKHKAEQEVARVIEETTGFAQRRVARLTKLGFVMIGMAAVVGNAFNTTRPLVVYRHDVWDGVDHVGGYFAARIYLLLCWGLLLPILSYGFLLFCYLVYRTYSRLARLGPLAPVAVRPLSSDGAGGLRHVTTAMMAVVVNAFPVGLCPAALVYLHGPIPSIIFGTLCWIIVMCGIFFLPLSSVHVAMRKRKHLILAEIERQFDLSFAAFRESLGDGCSGPQTASNDVLRAMDALYDVYRRTEKMPVWPFDSKALSKFFSVVVLQLALTLLGAILQKLV
ncbi:MAG: hypothetical protein FJ279_06390 [Planctomycetes bacterium]|nr:hypothetical protein [Planctomycetota bacterium]MBM4083448.1 hypothetical protein [Planctomycetota bacterium]